MCQFSNLSCEMMTEGWWTPAASMAAPKAAPERNDAMTGLYQGRDNNGVEEPCQGEMPAISKHHSDHFKTALAELV